VVFFFFSFGDFAGGGWCVFALGEGPSLLGWVDHKQGTGSCIQVCKFKYKRHTEEGASLFVFGWRKMQITDFSIIL